MLLLNLPPELFQQIIGIYATTVSAIQAAKSRKVSKTFCSYINYELFARQPNSKFTARPAKRLLEKNLALFLSFRVKSLNGALSFPPSLIGATGNKLKLFGGGSGATTIEAWTQIVIETIVAQGSHVVNLAVAPSFHQRRGLDDPLAIDYIALAVAVYSNNERVVAAMLQAGIDSWGQSEILGSIVYAAAGADSVSIMKMLLVNRNAREANEAYTTCDRLQLRILVSSLRRASLDGRWDVAAALLPIFFEHSVRFPPYTIGTWVKAAIAANHYGFMIALREVRYLSSSGSDYTNQIFDGLLLSQNLEPILRFCIHNKFLFGRGTIVESIEGSRKLLYMAVRDRNLRLAPAAINVNRRADHPFAFRLAIRNHDLTMVRLLLENGVDPEARTHRPTKQSTCELAGQGTEIHDELEKAIQQMIQALNNN